MSNKILIAHQSTIPHYRIKFYEELKNVKTKNWDFSVVYDSKISAIKNYKIINPANHSLSIINTKTKICRLLSKYLFFQYFIFSIRDYEILIVENALNNISYPLSFLLKRKKIILWGHGKDFSAANPSLLKKVLERFKLFLCKKSDGFLAYTEGVKQILLNNNIKEKNITVLNNTIDIMSHRKKFLSTKNKIQNKLNSQNSLLFVGRLNKRKKIEFLLDSFLLMKKMNPSFKLLLVGQGDTTYVNFLKNKYKDNNIKFLGEITDQQLLCKLYIKSNLFVFPGDVGLGPLHALCYNLIPVIIESRTHNPEREYLNNNNSFIFPSSITKERYASEIIRICSNKIMIEEKQKSSWESIKHLTLENMAKNFARGIEKII